MLKKEQFLKEKKEFAEMLGMSLEEYENYCKQNKINTKLDIEKVQHDNSVLEKLGLSNKDLLTR